MKRTKLKHVIQKTALISKEKGADIIKIKFPYNPQNVSQIKTITGRIFNLKKKYWSVPLSLDNCLTLKKWGYSFSEGLKEWGNAEWTRLRNITNIDNIPNFSADLFPYQRQGVTFLERQNGRGLIADEMGLGKTIQALAWLQLHREKVPVIIICPASLKLNWAKEAYRFMQDPSITILNGTKANKLSEHHIIIINYDILPEWLDVLIKMKPQVIICDEVHYIKNAGSKSAPVKRTKAVMQLCKNVPHIIALSGTPIENRPLEILNIIKIINPNIFPSAWYFKQRYCGPSHNGFGWAYNGATNIDELFQILSKNVMIRRKKADVLKELPDKVYTTIELEIDNRKDYDFAENDFIEYLKEALEIRVRQEFGNMLKQENGLIEINDHKLERLKDAVAEKASVLSQIEKLKQLSAAGKLKAIINWVENFLETDNKLVLFCTHRFMINALEQRFKKISVKIDGSVPPIERQKAVENFQNNKKIRLFLGNIKAAGVGITLTVASHIGILELPWSPGELNQAVDRCHRIGQQNSVNVYYFIAENTIEQKIISLLNEKAKVLAGVLDGVQTTGESMITQLIEEYTK